MRRHDEQRENDNFISTAPVSFTCVKCNPNVPLVESSEQNSQYSTAIEFIGSESDQSLLDSFKYEEESYNQLGLLLKLYSQFNFTRKNIQQI